jgi:hypothetical protein
MGGHGRVGGSWLLAEAPVSFGNLLYGSFAFDQTVRQFLQHAR